MSDILFKPIQENMEALFGDSSVVLNVILEALNKDKPTKEELEEVCRLIDLFESVRGALNSNYLEVINKMKEKDLFYDTKTKELHKFTVSDKVILELPKLV